MYVFVLKKGKLFQEVFFSSAHLQHQTLDGVAEKLLFVTCSLHYQVEKLLGCCGNCNLNWKFSLSWGKIKYKDATGPRKMIELARN